VGETINEKNIFETKNARRVYVEGSLFSNHWDAWRSQYFAIALKSGSDIPGGGQGSPWAVSEEIVFENDRISHINGGVSLARDFFAAGARYDPLKPQHIKFTNVLFDDLGSGRFGNSRTWALYMGAVDDLSFKHVSMIDPIDVVDDYPDAGFVMESISSYRMEVIDSIVPINSYSFRTVCGEGIAGLNAATAGWFDSAGNTCERPAGVSGSWNVKGNIFPKMRSYHNANAYPTENFYPEDFSSTGMQGYRRCGASPEADPCDLAISDFSLSAGSQFKSQATDSTDPGINAAVLSNRTLCTVSGDTRPCIIGISIPIPVPTPTPSPSPTPVPTPTPTPTPNPDPEPVTAVVGGRVTSRRGQGISRVYITVEGPDGSRSTFTDRRGGFSFTGLPIGVTYTFSAMERHSVFLNPTQTIYVDGDRSDLSFVSRK
jgi:hypothetical protein